ncbi:MAG: DUF3899 domain-containing protein [Oscillospiraceae bacterium]|nr:DUF3899 domain-containing protein [Oscillospiraceae bacterium]
MSEKVQDFLTHLVVGAVIAAGVFFLNLSREYGALRCLCDGFFVAAVLLLGMGTIKTARNKGSFDVAGYGVSYTIGLVFPALRREEKEDMAQYRERKAGERKSSKGMLLAGLVYLALSVLSLVVYELAQG